MDAKQENRLTMYRAVATLLKASTTLTAGIKAFATAQSELQAGIDQIDALAQVQATRTEGVSASKEEELAQMAEAALAVAGGVRSYAKAKGLTELAARVRLTPSDFSRCRAIERVRLAQQVHDAAASVVENLADYDVTAAELTGLAKEIAEASASLDAPRAATGTRKSATTRLPAAFRAMDELLKERIDPLALKLKPTQPAFYANYLAARVIVDVPGGRATAATTNTKITATSAATATTSATAGK